jgi:NADPH:quinone reductase-like Zn-dependent oxidoreductase
MKAIILKEPGGVENLEFVALPIPTISDTEVLVKVKAISINPVDVKVRRDPEMVSWLFGDQRPVILGWDISGEVIQKGKHVKLFQCGDSVFGMVNFPGVGNAYAEYVAVPEDHLALKPRHISHEEAAATTLAALTAWQALFTHSHIKRDDKVIVHAASGGVGHFAVQIAKHLGAFVIGTSSEMNRAFVLSLGADKFINYKSNKIELCVNYADFVLDTIGESVLLQAVKTAKPHSRIITLPTPDFSEEAQIAANSKNVELFYKRVKFSGRDMKILADLLSREVIKPHVSEIFHFSDMKKAHLQIESGRTVGKVVVKI